MFKNRTFLKHSKACMLCCALMVLTITFFSCKGKRGESLFSYEIKEVEVNKNGIVQISKSAVDAGKSYGSQFVDGNEQVVICGLYSPSSVYYYYLQEDRHEIYELPFAFDLEKDRVHFDEEAITVFHANNLLSYNIRGKKLDTIKTDILSSDEFLKKELYGGGIYRGEDSYLLNYGKINHGNFDNFVDTYAAYIVNNDTVKKSLPYTEEFETEYVHYNELLPLQNSQYVYYTFSVIPKLVQYDIETDQVVKTVDLVNKKQYKKYDHTKITDMGYLATYSYNTNYNLRLFGIHDFVVLLNYGPDGENTPSKNKWVYNLYIYDKDLNLLGDIAVQTPFLHSYVSTKDNSIYFSNIPESKVYVYTISKR